MMERCAHVSFCLIIAGYAVHGRKVAHPKYPKMVILDEHVRPCLGIILPMIEKLIRNQKNSNNMRNIFKHKFLSPPQNV